MAVLGICPVHSRRILRVTCNSAAAEIKCAVAVWIPGTSTGAKNGARKVGPFRFQALFSACLLCGTSIWVLVP